MTDTDCWLHPDAEVRESEIEGRGLFAQAAIARGTVVSRLGGRLVTEAELREIFRTADTYVDTIAVTEDRHLVLPPRRPNGYGNHSCDPNLWWHDAYTLVARRDIAADEELTNDYGTSSGLPDFRMDCRCGAGLCRGVITGDDWRRPELRERYGEHWVPVLLERINDNRPDALADTRPVRTHLTANQSPRTDQRESLPADSIAARAASRRATGTRNGEQET
ncbi:hypothetical protein ABH920_001481 [Catenulispora sp. EB89]|uniref:SET domain-containing protein n=1 Tax=Catenulispora sp. EB89 TaxID=3156257 RepID=UPI003519D732